MNDRLWSVKEIAQYSNYGMTIARKIAAQPDFPKPVKALQGSHPRWVEREVRLFFEGRRN
jgi:predicted DNA-binding transcriptional regulator AlpA